MTPLAAIANPKGFSRHGHIYVPTVTARDRANLAWFGEEAKRRRVTAGPGFGGMYGRFIMRSASPARDPWFESNYQANISHYFGAEAEELYLPGEPASGAITGKIAGNVLSPVTSPLYRQTLSGAHLGAGFDDGTTDSFDAANATVHDLTTGAFAILVPFAILTAPIAIGRTCIGKRQGTPYYGWEFYFTAASGLHIAVTGTLTSRDIFPVPAGAKTTGLYYCLYFGSVASDIIGAYASFGNNTYSYSAVGSITSTATFALGSQRLTALGVVLGPILLFSGANAENVIAARATKLPAWWAEATA